MQAIQLPRKMMEWMGLKRTTTLCGECNEYCESVLTHTLVGENCLLGTLHATFIVQLEFTVLVLCCVLCREGLGLISICTWPQSSTLGMQRANAPLWHLPAYVSLPAAPVWQRPSNWRFHDLSTPFSLATKTPFHPFHTQATPGMVASLFE